jgi:hypothetical protein
MISTMRRRKGCLANSAELVSDCSLVEITLKQRIDNVRVLSIWYMNSLTAQHHKSEPKFKTIKHSILYAKLPCIWHSNSGFWSSLGHCTEGNCPYSSCRSVAHAAEYISGQCAAFFE